MAPEVQVHVEASRQARLEKQQSRYRDRGGVFVPATTNPLLDVLLAREPNGESPRKIAAKKTPKVDHHSPREHGEGVGSPTPARKGRGRAAGGTPKNNAKKKTPARAKKSKDTEGADGGGEIEGSGSRSAKPTPKKSNARQAQSSKVVLPREDTAPVPPATKGVTGKKKPQHPESDVESEFDELEGTEDTKTAGNGKRKNTNSNARAQPANKRRKVANSGANTISKTSPEREASPTTRDESPNEDENPPLPPKAKREVAKRSQNARPPAKRRRGDDEEPDSDTEDSHPTKLPAYKTQAGVKNELPAKKTVAAKKPPQNGRSARKGGAGKKSARSGRKTAEEPTASPDAEPDDAPPPKKPTARSAASEPGNAAKYPVEDESEHSDSAPQHGSHQSGRDTVTSDPPVKPKKGGALPSRAEEDPVPKTKKAPPAPDSPQTAEEVEPPRLTKQTAKANTAPTAEGKEKAPRKPSATKNGTGKSRTLNPSSRSHKENKKSRFVRKPRPRPSMFPPPLPPDSDDDPIDFLS